MYAQYLIGTSLTAKTHAINFFFFQRYAEPSDVEEYMRRNNLF